MHRFGITFHRNQRSRGTFKNELENINGIGKQTATALLKEFKSVKNIRSTSFEELAAVVGAAKAALLKFHFNAS